MANICATSICGNPGAAREHASGECFERALGGVAKSSRRRQCARSRSSASAMTEFPEGSAPS